MFSEKKEALSGTESRGTVGTGRTEWGEQWLCRSWGWPVIQRIRADREWCMTLRESEGPRESNETNLKGLWECTWWAYWLAATLKVKMLHFPFLCVSSRSVLNSLLCLNISEAWTSFLLSACTEGQTPFLQPAGILLLMLQEDAKLDSRGGHRVGQQHPSLLHSVMKENYRDLEICDELLANQI